jgi:hypothetical protein
VDFTKKAPSRLPFWWLFPALFPAPQENQNVSGPASPPDASYVTFAENGAQL